MWLGSSSAYRDATHGTLRRGSRSGGRHRVERGGRCHRAVPEGCPTGQICDGVSCADPPAEGEPCLIASDARRTGVCASGLECTLEVVDGSYLQTCRTAPSGDGSSHVIACPAWSPPTSDRPSMRATRTRTPEGPRLLGSLRARSRATSRLKRLAQRSMAHRGISALALALALGACIVASTNDAGHDTGALLRDE